MPNLRDGLPNRAETLVVTSPARTGPASYLSLYVPYFISIGM
jgi:hypothetical protein